jgi:phosphatidate phosphatase APP1
MCCLAFALMLPMGDAKSEITDDEVVVFYPTYGYQVDDGRAWKLSIHGSIFEPEQNSLKRAAALGLLRRLLRLSSEQAETEIFKQRARSFLVDNEGGKTIHVRLGDHVYPAGTSGSNGHFTRTLQLTGAEVERLRRTASGQTDWLTFQAVTRADDPRTFAGRVQLIAPEGLSVISDVDDTIKISMVTSRRALMANTFLRPYEPVEGMPKLYREWADGGVVFHYLSASPWQLYGPLAEFRRSKGFPAGSFHLKLFRLKDSTALDLFGSQEQYKSGVIERILADFPHRRFILVGDSGEQDPEIYAAAARKHPDQIVRILIRDVGEGGGDAGRFRAAFDGMPDDHWRVFRTPEELNGALPADSPSK